MKPAAEDVSVIAFSSEQLGPLAGVRVLDLTDGKAELTARLLGDLGADVLRIEPPEGRSSRRQEPVRAGVSLYDATRNTNKRSVVLDLADEVGRQQFWRLLDTADIVVEDGPPGHLDSLGIAPSAMRARRPRLVVVSISDFGQTGPYRDWVATEHVHLALAGVLSRSGLPGLPPLLPPGRMATDSAATAAAWCSLLAYTNSLETDLGDHVDVSIYESTAQVFDPGYGIGGSATAGRTAAEGPRGRPDARHLYPIFPCADGHVRLCVLAPRQWQGLFRWLGEPAALADPALASIGPRQAASELIFPIVERHFADKTREQILVEGRQHGVPAGGLLTPAEVLAGQHLEERAAFVDVELAPGMQAKLVNGALEIDGRRAGVQRPAPRLGEHTTEVLGDLDERSDPPPQQTVPTTRPRRPLEGVLVLDLGVIVVGAETGRLLADMGATVVKVENQTYIDSSRGSGGAERMTISFAWGHRNKTSLGLNLRDPRGVALFKRLAAGADVVLSNFKPGTMESLGLGYDEIAELNPGIVMLDSSAYGPTGPWSGRMGYGPLVRAETGVSALWRYPERVDSFSDASTIYPDHVAARVGALAVLARLVERRRTGRGGTASIAQAEVVLDHFGSWFAAESVSAGSMVAVGNDLSGDAPRGVYPCAGEDEWLVVTVRDDQDWRRLVTVLSAPELLDEQYATAAGRAAQAAVIDAALTRWTSSRSPREAMTRLQGAGVPAGMMQRVPDYLDDPHLQARGFLRTMGHPLLRGTTLAENGPAHFEQVLDPDLRPAPMLGEHTRDLCRVLLGMSAAEIDGLVADGVLEQWEAPELDATRDSITA